METGPRTKAASWEKDAVPGEYLNEGEESRTGSRGGLAGVRLEINGTKGDSDPQVWRELAPPPASGLSPEHTNIDHEIGTADEEEAPPHQYLVVGKLSVYDTWPPDHFILGEAKDAGPGLPSWAPRLEDPVLRLAASLRTRAVVAVVRTTHLGNFGLAADLDGICSSASVPDWPLECRCA
ncbi:hypothetical protein LZ30DRAFT_785719 [Colletotrichum cereale]|nr:hypothetical protein LZ30DRAFT_785719 [Colletotrichum cereale]